MKISGLRDWDHAARRVNFLYAFSETDTDSIYEASMGSSGSVMEADCLPVGFAVGQVYSNIVDEARPTQHQQTIRKSVNVTCSRYICMYGYVYVLKCIYQYRIEIEFTKLYENLLNIDSLIIPYRDCDSRLVSIRFFFWNVMFILVAISLLINYFTACHSYNIAESRQPWEH